MKKNRFTAYLLTFTLAISVLASTLTGCVRELTEEQSTALVALQNAVTYYETNDNISHWEELVALAAANRADGIGVNWGALTLPEAPAFPPAPQTENRDPEASAPDPQTPASEPQTSAPDPQEPDTDPQEPAPYVQIDVSPYPAAVFTAILYGEDYAAAAQTLSHAQNPDSGSFSDAYINQHIWAMITLNAALDRSGYDYDKAAAYLLTFQNEDGGFSYTSPALSENKSDMDLTGIAAVALAPYYEDHKRSPEMKALVAYFSLQQQKSGGYAGFGGENPSTISAAIWGLSALHQKLPLSEDGLSPVDALLAYQNEDGSFRAGKDDEHVFDSFSTRQAMIALSDVINDVEIYSLLSEDAESYRIEHISGPAISLSIDFPEESGIEDVSVPLTVAENSTALDALLLYGKLKEIPVTFSGGGSSAYIQSVDQVKEKDYGDTSGWIYRLNGETLSQAAGTVVLQDGDQLEWLFVTDINETIME